MADSNQNQKVYFTEKANKIIMEILERNNLKETLEEAVEKIIQKKDCLINIIYDTSRDFTEGKISEKDFAIRLQKQIEVSPQTAESLIKDIKEKLLPVAIKVNIGEAEKIEIEKTVAVKPVRLISETQDINKKNAEVPQIAKKIPMEEKKEKRKKDIKEIEEILKIKEIKRQPKKQDSYLEPIE